MPPETCTEQGVCRPPATGFTPEIFYQRSLEPCLWRNGPPCTLGEAPWIWFMARRAWPSWALLSWPSLLAKPPTLSPDNATCLLNLPCTWEWMCLTALTSIFGPLTIKERKKEEGEEAGSNLSKNKPHKIPRAKTTKKNKQEIITIF